MGFGDLGGGNVWNFELEEICDPGVVFFALHLLLRYISPSHLVTLFYFQHVVAVWETSVILFRMAIIIVQAIISTGLVKNAQLATSLSKAMWWN